MKTLADKKLQDEKISSAFELKYLVGADFRYEEPQTQDAQTKSGISNGLFKQNSATGFGMSGNSNGLFNGGKHDRDNPNSATRPMSQFTINSNSKAPDLFQRGISQKSQYFMKPPDAGYEGEENIDFSDEDNTLVSIRNRTSLKVRTVGLKSNPLSKKH